MKKHDFGSNKRLLKRIIRKACGCTPKVECVLTELGIFRITFKHRYVSSFSRRVYDWICFVSDKVHQFWLRHFKGSKKKSLRDEILLNEKIEAPLHFKCSGMPIDEKLLEKTLTQNGFKITDEDFGIDTTSYNVVKR